MKQVAYEICNTCIKPGGYVAVYTNQGKPYGPKHLGTSKLFRNINYQDIRQLIITGTSLASTCIQIYYAHFYDIHSVTVEKTQI